MVLRQRIQSTARSERMAYKITEACTACGTCKESCPAEAIREGEKYNIDPDTCIDCGTCVDACPVKAIVEG
jgi:ferredoxin